MQTHNIDVAGSKRFVMPVDREVIRCVINYRINEDININEVDWLYDYNWN
jgi:hypothetical protein